VGRDRPGVFASAIEDYLDRLSHYARLESLAVPQASGSKLSADEARRIEGRRILDKVKPREWLIALDPGGQMLTSAELARFVEQAQSQSRDLLFAIGGDQGLDPEVTGAAHLLLSLSRLTLPHRLARLVLIEQLYRAFTVLRGEPYHK
jgi:23S rRNA (pseudouridine1915-N3)-methyltransferase